MTCALVELTEHAIVRYQERVKPAFAFWQAKHEMEHLLETALLHAERPPWADGFSVYPEAAAWMWLVPDGSVACPLVIQEGDIFAVSTFTRSGFSSPRKRERIDRLYEQEPLRDFHRDGRRRGPAYDRRRPTYEP